MAYDLKHTGEAVDAAVSAVESGSVVTDNTVSSIALGEAKPASADAIAKELQKKVDKAEGKGLSTIDYDYEEQAKVTKNTSDIATNAANIAEQGTILSKHGEDIAKNAEDIAKNAKDIAKKANTTEYYPAMAVGVADNLRGRGEATEEEFTYRPSAGASNSISEEGVATMNRIKGNSLVWNQLFKQPQSSFTITLNDTEKYKYIETGTTFPVGTKCFVIANYEASENTVCSQIGIGLSYFSSFYGDIKWIYFSEQKGVLSGIVESKDSTNTTIILRTYNLTNGSITFSNVRCVNLTKMFGAGNEPTTIEEFYARIPEGVDMNVYNEGQLISMNANSIETTGLNQWNEKWVNGDISNGVYTKNGERICSRDFIRVVQGQTYTFSQNLLISLYDSDKNFIPYAGDGDFKMHDNLVDIGTVRRGKFPEGVSFIKFKTYYDYTGAYNNDICINLSHSGLRDGEYEPYEEHTIDLPEIAQYFPDGMKSVGGVFDEINEHEAVQRVGQRSYTEDDNDNPAVMTDGVNTIYLLDTPKVTPIPARAINLNYPVWDWGTERAVSDVPSAPFRADIIYGFNAVDTIRTNKLNIEDILRRLAELEAKTVVEQSVEE